MPEKFEFKFKVADELAAVVPAVRAAGAVTAVIHEGEPDEGGYWAEIPAMPGCVSEGDTLEEMKANIREAAEGWLEATRDQQTRDQQEREKNSRQPESERAAESAASL